MRQLVGDIMAKRGLTNFDEETFALFCKNSALVDVVEMRSIQEELSAPNWSDVVDELMDAESSA